VRLFPPRPRITQIVKLKALQKFIIVRLDAVVPVPKAGLHRPLERGAALRCGHPYALVQLLNFHLVLELLKFCINVLIVVVVVGGVTTMPGGNDTITGVRVFGPLFARTTTTQTVGQQTTINPANAFERTQQARPTTC
jgi:hypothetical protein